MTRLRYDRNNQHGFIEYVFESLPETGMVKIVAHKSPSDCQEFTLILEGNSQKYLFFIATSSTTTIMILNYA